MLLQLLADARDTLLLRYKPSEEYRYSAQTAAAVLLVLGIQNAAFQVPLLGSDFAAIAFSIITVILKWLVLDRVMRLVLGYYGMPKQSLLGFILVSEALMIPTVAAFYSEAASAVAIFWQIWCFWAQAAGLMYFSKLDGLKVLLGYVCYVIAMFAVLMLLLGIFSAFGWLDTAMLYDNFLKFLQTGQTVQP